MNFSQPGMSEHSDFCYESLNGSCPKFTYPTVIRIPLYIFFMTIIVLTICGNLLVIISIAHFKQLHTPTNCLVLSLAVTDFLLAVVIMPPSMVRTIETCWYFGDVVCKLHSSTDVMLSNVSILNLSFISIDRYYAVCQPLHYRTKITSVTIVIMILISWNLSFIIGFGMIFMKLNILGIEDFYDNNFHCFGGCFIFQSKTSAIIASVLSFYIPGFIMISIYQKIFHIALKQARSIHSTACQQIQTGNSTSISKMERKATKTLAIVLGVFLSCWSPFFVCNIIDPIINYSVPPGLFDALVWIGYLNSTSNPIVYAFFYSWFRKAFKMIISGKIFQAHSSRAKLSTE
ncbi:trace amine-associated receptor 1-like [Anguilla anguilla]|uniref:trace amine-associated receptor 1-like n=1 Tax=Anguilla anguilla TaxID=7936 RepID=UPI0015AAC298|nr:trace amine-associated receptor 1-like [Anguilla anguilla]